MKYIVPDSKIASVIEKLIKFHVLKLEDKKFKFVDDVSVSKAGPERIRVKIFVDRVKCAEISCGWGQEWGMLNYRIRRIIENFISGNFKVLISKYYSDDQP